MINIVLFEPEIPGNTGNIMRTCVATHTKLHLIKPLGFSLSENYIKRSGVNYIKDCDYEVYENIDDFYSKNKGEFYYLTRYGHKPHTSFDYSDTSNKVRALNLSNTVAIVLYEALRQQNYLDLLKDEPHKSKNFIEESD